jgi:hypothetical protein
MFFDIGDHIKKLQSVVNLNVLAHISTFEGEGKIRGEYSVQK